MSTAAPKPVKKSRWLDWKTSGSILADSPEGEPTKPSKPSFEAFVGATPGEFPIIRARSGAVGDATGEPERGIAWAEWRAADLNQLFRDQGVTGEPSRITAATVRHCEAARARKSEGVSAVDCAGTDEQPMSRAETTE
jgi:hypothetical protein